MYKRQVLRQAEAEFLTDALKRNNGNVTAVARAMDITPRAVHLKLRALGINAAAYRAPGGRP